MMFVQNEKKFLTEFLRSESESENTLLFLILRETVFPPIQEQMNTFVIGVVIIDDHDGSTKSWGKVS